jgi:hypothetical protein
MSIQNHFNASSPLEAERPAETIRRLYYLSGYKLMRMPRKNQVVEVVMGTAWITMNGEDFILHAGETLQLSESHEFALVSSLQQNRLVLAVG